MRAFLENYFDGLRDDQVMTALCMSSNQARARVIFGSVALKPFYLAGPVPLMEVAPDLVRIWDKELRGILQSCTRGAVTARA